jgi:hypothetical protein
VRKAIATTRSFKRTSARKIKTVDVGALSSAKTQLTLTQTSDRTQPGSQRADRVFVGEAILAGPCVPSRTQAGHPAKGLNRRVIEASDLVRPSHRRLAAGSPAAVLALGSC